jgi:hypothetical protein
MAKFRVDLVREHRPVLIEASRFEDSPDGKWITFIRVRTVSGRFFAGTRREQVQRFRADAVERIERIDGPPPLPAPIHEVRLEARPPGSGSEVAANKLDNT